MPPRNKAASLYDLQELLVLFVLAALVSNAAAGLACGLTGCLALAASAFLDRHVQCLLIERLDVFHYISPFFALYCNIFFLICKIKNLTTWKILKKVLL